MEIKIQDSSGQGAKDSSEGFLNHSNPRIPKRDVFPSAKSHVAASPLYAGPYVLESLNPFN